jgi:hypothetical protein
MSKIEEIAENNPNIKGSTVEGFDSEGYGWISMSFQELFGNITTTHMENIGHMKRAWQVIY